MASSIPSDRLSDFPGEFGTDSRNRRRQWRFQKTRRTGEGKPRTQDGERRTADLKLPAEEPSVRGEPIESSFGFPGTLAIKELEGVATVEPAVDLTRVEGLFVITGTR